MAAQEQVARNRLPELTVGDRLGNYRVVRQVGQGGWGTVYLVEHAAIGRRLAAKVLRRDLARDDEAVSRFFNEARAGHVAVWTGSEMIVWGGANDVATFGGGARYDPAANRWWAMSRVGAPAERTGHAGVWTGSELLIWGGGDTSGAVSGGGRYDPVADTWRALPAQGEPAPRREPSGVWSGTELLVWGGQNGPAFEGTGGRFDPVAGTWRAISQNGAPVGRSGHAAVYAGGRMVV